MKRTINLKYILFTSPLLATILLFSNCKKESESELSPSIETVSATASETVVQKNIDLSAAKSDNGFAVLIKRAIPESVKGDGSSDSQASIVRIFENGKEIGPAHSNHADIRSKGSGRFSHWGTSLYLSASDNTDPRTNGRKYTYATGGGTTAKPEELPNSGVVLPTNLIGFANVNGQTTGGRGGQTVTVTNLSELSKAAGSTSPMIIQVKGTINGSGSVYVKSNKSIIGINGGTLNGVGLKVYEVSNVIIQNLTIKNVVAGSDDNDCVNIKYSDHVWIDHCDFSADRNRGWDYYDGLIDITKKSTYITISWSKIHDSFKALLLGVSANDKGGIKVTLYNNHFYNLSERVPSLVAGEAHVFNNYFVNVSGYCVGSRIDGIVRTDNNYFSNCPTPIDTNLGGDAAGYISGSNTNFYEKSGKNDITTSEKSWNAPYEYKSVLASAQSVPAQVTAGAGPIL